MRFGRPQRLILVLLVFAAAAYTLRGYTTDDTYIHLRYAQNFLERGEFSFNPGSMTNGATSPLWVLGLALLMKLGLAPLTAAWVLGAVSGLLALLMVDAIVTRFTFQEHWKGLLLLAAACDPWFLRWTFSGMETPLATCLLLVLLWPLVSGRDLGWGVTREPLWRRYLAWGAAAGLAGLVRPEFLVLAPAALPVLLWFEYYRAGAVDGLSGRHRARPHAPLRAAIAGWLVVVTPWFVYARWTFGGLLPDTVAAKSGSALSDPLAVLENLLLALKPLAAVQGFFWLGTVVLVALVLMRNRTFRPEAGDGDERRDLRAVEAPWAGWSTWGPVGLIGVVAVWSVILLGGYAVRQVWVISRYVSPLAPPLLLGMSLVVEWLLRGRAIDRRTLTGGRIVIISALTLTLATNLWIFIAAVTPHARSFPVGLRECYAETGDWLRENTEPGTVIAALDIGALGFASERTILDLMGLVSPEVRELGLSMGFAEMVESGAWLTAGPGGGPPHYFVDRTDGAPRWRDAKVDGVSFTLVRSCVMQGGVGLRENQPWTVSLYRLSPTVTRVRSSDGG